MEGPVKVSYCPICSRQIQVLGDETSTRFIRHTNPDTLKECAGSRETIYSGAIITLN